MMTSFWRHDIMFAAMHTNDADGLSDFVMAQECL